MTTTYAAAHAFASFALRGQTDKSGAPLIEHAERMADSFDIARDHEVRIVSILHDVLEDSRATLRRRDDFDGWTLHLDGLTLDLTDTAADDLDLLTRPEGITYRDYIRRLHDGARRRGCRSSAAPVKIADLYDHLAGCPESLVPRYEWALRCLMGEVD